MIMSCIWGTVHLALKLKHDHITSQFLAHFQLDMTEHWTEWVVRASLQNSQMIHSFVRCKSDVKKVPLFLENAYVCLSFTFVF